MRQWYYSLTASIDNIGGNTNRNHKQNKIGKSHFRRHFVGRVLLRDFNEISRIYFGFIGLCVVSKMSKRRIEVLDPFIKKKRFVYLTFVICCYCHALKTFRQFFFLIISCIILKVCYKTAKSNFLYSLEIALGHKFIWHYCTYFFCFENYELISVLRCYAGNKTRHPLRNVLLHTIYDAFWCHRIEKFKNKTLKSLYLQGIS